MQGARRSRWIGALVLAAACFLPARAPAHPGSGIVVDRLGHVYFVDMVSGLWRLDAHGALTRIHGPAFHWMALDADDRFAAVQLPSGSGGDFAKLGASPTLILASDFPVAMGPDGALYYPSREDAPPLRITRLLPSGERSIIASVPTPPGQPPIQDLKGLAFGPDGALYYTENDAIRRVSREGRISTIAEKIAPAGCASPDGPMLRGLDVDARGTIYVAASGCRSVLKVTPAGEIAILPQIETNPWPPTGVALFGDDVYVLEFQVAESEDRGGMLPRVRKIAADGKTTIVATVTQH